MKFECQRRGLLDVVASATQPVKGGQRVASLNGLLCKVNDNTLQVTGSDLEVTVQASTPVTSSDDGEAVIPARLLTDITRQVASDTVTVVCNDEGEATISGGRTEYALRTYTAGEYPKLAEVDGDWVEVDAGTLRTGIERVIRSASTDSARPALTGVLFEARENVLRLVATDSYRLALCEVDALAMLAGNAQAVVPATALQMLMPLLEPNATVSVCFDFKQQLVAFGVATGERVVRLTVRLLEGKYPAYQELLPDSYPNNAEVDRQAFAGATSRVSLVGRDNKAPVRVAQSTNGLTLNVIAQDRGTASDTIDAEYTGEEVTVAFNPDYLQDGLTATASKRVRLETENSTKPAILRPVTDDDNEPLFLYLLMPVRIS